MNNIEILNLNRDKIKFILENHNLFDADQVKLAAKREVIFSRNKQNVNADYRLQGMTDSGLAFYSSELAASQGRILQPCGLNGLLGSAF